MPIKRASQKAKSGHVFGQARRQAKMFRAGLYACGHDMLVQIRWQGRKMTVPLSQLEVIGADESTDEAIGDWHYWVGRGYCL
jgi:Calcium binding